MAEYHQQDANTLNKDFLIKNNDFLRDASQFLRERRGFDFADLTTAEDIYSLFVSHMRDADVNELTAVNDLAHVTGLEDKKKAQIGKLYSTWDRMESGGTGFWNAARDYGLGIATAPSTYIGLITGGAGKLAAIGGTVAARLVARQAAVGALKRTMQRTTTAATAALPKGIVARGAVKGAIGAGLTEGTAGGIRGAAAEQARVEADITGEREFDVGKVALEAGIGLGAGAVLGGGVGAITGRRQMKALGIIEKATTAKAKIISEAQAKVGSEILQDIVIDTPIGSRIEVTEAEQIDEFVNILNHIRKSGFGKEALDKGVVKEGLENFDKRLISPVDPEKSIEESLQYRLAGAAMDILKTAMRTKGIDGEAILKTLNLDLKKDRITTIIAKIINNTDDEVGKGKFISDILEKYDLTLQQFTSLYVSELHNAGKILGLQSAVVRNVTQAFSALEDVPISVRKADPTDASKTVNEELSIELTEDTKAFIRAMEKGSNATSLFRKLKRGTFTGVKEFDRFTKGMMTIQPATTMRNLENAMLRSFIYVFTNVLEGALDTGIALIRKGISPNDPQVQKAFSSGLQKMRKGPAFARNLFDNSESKALVNLFSEDMPEEYLQLFRSLADIEGAAQGKWLTGFARKFNALNTFIDNSFKRAIFVSELSQRVGGRKAFLELAEQGRFNQISTQNIQDSIDEALDFSYQTRFTGKDKTEFGLVNANSAAARFIKIFSTPILGSGFIPYPRFIASMVKHNFQYAPLVGLLPLERLGYRIKKAYPDKLQKAINEGKPLSPVQQATKDKYDGGFAFGKGRSINKIVAQQAVGFSLLYGAMQLRASQGPYAEWYELKQLPIPSPSSRFPGAELRMQDIGKGRYADAKAFYGVYAPYMLVADLLLRSLGFWDKPAEGQRSEFDPSKLIANEENRKRVKTMAKRAMMDNLNSKFYRDLAQSLFGAQFKVGQGLYILDSVAGVLDATDVQKEKNRDMIADQISTFAANYLVRPVVPINMARDVLGTVDPAWKKLPDRGDINAHLMGAYGDAWRNFYGIVTRPIPIKEGKLFGYEGFTVPGYERGAVSPETTRMLTAEGGMQKQISGIGGGRFKNEIQEEVSRLNINKPWEKFKRYRAPMLRRIAAKISGDKVEKNIINYIRTNNIYLKADPDEQKVLLLDQLKKVRSKIGENMELYILTDKEVKAMIRPEQDQLMAEFYKLEYHNNYSSAERNMIEKDMKEGKIQELGPIDLSKATGTIARRAYRLAIKRLRYHRKNR